MQLYHATPAELAEECLTPRTKNVLMEENGLAARLTDYSEDNIPYVFASPDKAFSATYAVPKGIRLGNYRGHGGTNLLLVDKESAIGDPDFHGGLYVFPDTGFIPLHDREGRPTEQMVSPHPVDLKSAGFVPLKNFNDLMRESVQVYQIADHYGPDDFHGETRGLGENEFLKKIRSLCEEGKLRWLNEERSLNPVESLIPRTERPHEKTGPSFEGPVFGI
jgi:hypothetical protein